MDVAKIDASCAGKIIVAGAFAPYHAIDIARKNGVKAIITGGIDDQDIKKLLGYDIGVAITGHENIGITIVCTEGFGRINMAQKTFNLLSALRAIKPPSMAKPKSALELFVPKLLFPWSLKNRNWSLKKKLCRFWK